MASVDGIDWMKHMQVSLLDQPGLADAYPNEWVKSRCRIAAEIALTESGNAEPPPQFGRPERGHVRLRGLLDGDSRHAMAPAQIRVERQLFV